METTGHTWSAIRDKCSTTTCSRTGERYTRNGITMNGILPTVYLLIPTSHPCAIRMRVLVHRSARDCVGVRVDRAQSTSRRSK